MLDEDRAMTRLGQGLFSTGVLADATMELSLQTLGRMKAIAEGFDVQDLRAIATSAVREASNGREFCREAWRRCRVRIEVVSPEEEAKLVFKSVARHYNLDDRLTAVVDIGGGSTEVILAAGGVIEQLHSCSPRPSSLAIGSRWAARPTRSWSTRSARRPSRRR